MLHYRRAGLIVLLTLISVLGGGAAAWGQPMAAAGLAVAVNADDPAAPVVTLTNGGAAPCVVASTAVGTVGFTRVEQDGSAIEPSLYDAAFADSLDVLLAAGLRELDPGDSLDLPIRVAPVGPTGHSLDAVAWSGAIGAVGSLYPVDPDRPLVLEVVYALPIAVADGQTACAMGATASTEVLTERDWVRWAVIGGAALVLLILVVLMVVLMRGRRRRGRRNAAAASAGVAVLVLVGATLTIDGWGLKAHAEITVDPALADAWASCSATLHGPDGDPAGILPTLEGPGVNVHIVVAAPGSPTGEGAVSSTEIFIYWNTDDRHPYAGSGGNADPCTSLYHEMYHAWEDANGGQDHSPCVTADGPSGLPVNEVNATRAQNQLRRLLGMPERSHYGDTPLPAGECLPPEEQPREEPCAPNCADSNGDPHLVTFDGRRYDFQAVGEFVALHSTSGDLDVQVRQVPINGSRIVSVNQAVALNVAGDRVQVTAERSRLALHIAGQPHELAPARLEQGGSVEVGRNTRGRTITVAWPDGSKVIVSPIGVFGLHLTVGLAPERAGGVEGLFGDFDGDPTNDIKPRGGDPIEPTFDELYPSFADSWRIDDATSLFTYSPGTSTQTFTDRTLPEREARAENLANRAAAEAICRRLGVTEPGALAGCTLDIGLTGLLDFAVAMGATQERIGSFGLTGEETALTIANPGEQASLTFRGTTGQIVFVDVPVTTLPSMCSPVSVRGPDGKVINSGCLINGQGSVDRTELPITGEYTVVLDPSDDRIGTAWVRVITAVDQTGQITPGVDVTATIAQPGAEARFNFHGAAGQAVFVGAPTSTLPSQCSPLRLRGPDGRDVGSGCIINGRGYVDRVDLPVTGEYTFVLDPSGRETGVTRLRLTFATDQVGTISINGPEMTAIIQQAGAQARFTFTATAGQQVSVIAPSSTLVSQCSPLRLVGPADERISSGCIINGKGDIESTTLPTTGQYTLIVDPHAGDTGQTRLALRSP